MASATELIMSPRIVLPLLKCVRKAIKYIPGLFNESSANFFSGLSFHVFSGDDIGLHRFKGSIVFQH